MAELTKTGQLALQNVLNDTASQPKPELGFLEGVSAAYDAAELSKSNYFGALVGDPIRKALVRYGELTGETPPLFESRMTTAEAQANLAWLDQRKANIEKYQKAAGGPADPFLKTGDQIRSEAADTKRTAMEKASRAGWVASLTGGLGSGVTDPMNLALLPTGIFAAESILGTAAIEAAIGYGATLGIEKSAQVGDIELGMPKSEAEMQQAALLGGMFSGIIGGGIKAGIKYLPKKAVRFGDKNLVPALRESERGALPFDGNRLTVDEHNSILALHDASETMPDLLTHDAQLAHMDAVQAAVNMLGEEDPMVRNSYRTRLNDSLTRLSESANRGLSEANAAMEAAGVSMEKVSTTKGTTFAYSIVKPELERMLGIKVKLQHLADDSVRIRSTNPRFAFDEVFPANRTWAEARAQADRLTQRLGVDSIPLVGKEQAIMKAQHLFDDYIKRADFLDTARMELTRGVGDVITDLEGKPFVSRNQAMKYAESRNIPIKKSNIVRFKSKGFREGFAIKPDNPFDVPGYQIETLSEPSKRAEYVDNRIAKAAEQTRTEPKVDSSPKITPDNPDIGAAANAKLERETKALKNFVDENPDFEVMWVDSDGNVSKMPASRVLEEIDKEGIEIDGTIVCMTE